MTADAGEEREQSPETVIGERSIASVNAGRSLQSRSEQYPRHGTDVHARHRTTGLVLRAHLCAPGRSEARCPNGFA